MGNPDWMSAAGAWVLENGHKSLLFVTRGRYPKSIMGMQTLELHTTGRKSGERRSTLLTAPLIDDGQVVLVASKGGYSDNPGWYKNLAAHPDIELTIDDRTSAWRARTASPEEKQMLWPEIVKRYKGYDGYQRNTDRDIPVVICEPIDPVV